MASSINAGRVADTVLTPFWIVFFSTIVSSVTELIFAESSGKRGRDIFTFHLFELGPSPSELSFFSTEALIAGSNSLQRMDKARRRAFEHFAYALIRL